MDSTTTLDDVVASAASYLYPTLAAAEDFDLLAAGAREAMRSVAARAVAACIERFDDELLAQAPPGWSVHARPARTVVTLAGEVTYRRRLYRDEHGRNRYPADELLGMPKRGRLASDAFLWLVRRASRVSYRAAAADFAEASGVEVSAMLPLRCVRREAALIRAELEAGRAPGARGISQLDVYAECDGLFVALQSPQRRREAIGRFFYEQGRKKKSLELKCGAVYAGTRSEGVRNVRGNVALFATAGGPGEFWDGMRKTIEADYEAADIETLHASSDAGGWCKSLPIADVAPRVEQGIDLFHVMKKVVRAFPDGAGREHLFSLALRRRPEALAEACDRVLPQVKGAARRKRVRELRDYVANNAELLRGGGSLGTMEATNAYAWAKRMKSWGVSWPRRGAEAMALVLCRVAAHRPLVAPPKDAFWTDREAEKRDESMARRGHEAMRAQTSGRGWEPMSAHLPLEKAPGAYLPDAFLSVRVR